MNRRGVLKVAAGALVNCALVRGADALVVPAFASQPAPRPADARRLSLVNTHTGETFSDAYWEAGNYVAGAMAAINHVMRDHRTGQIHAIDPRLLDQLNRLRRLVAAPAPYQIISGYRSAASNAALHEQSSGVATHSLHMDGRAIDIRVRGVTLQRLRDAALSMGAGGVGYYEASDFIHVDTGPVRRW